jgi:DNA-binding transcriptional MocR family regulator
VWPALVALPVLILLGDLSMSISPDSFVRPAYRSIGESLVRELARLMTDPEMISLAGGYPGPELFDREGLRASVDEALTHAPVATLQYGPTDGLLTLREAIAEWMQHCGTHCSPGELLVTAGSQQGFDLLVRTLLQPGDCAIAERPTYTGPLRVLKVADIETLTVGVDAEGLNVDELAELLRSRRQRGLSTPKLLYAVPTFANPSGATMTLERRLRLLELAVEFHFVIVEDDPYGELRFEGERVPHLAALVDQVPGSRPWVVHLGSVSKIIAPGLRLGWLKADEALRRPCMLAKQLDDISNPGFTQMTVQRYLRAGRLQRHLPHIVAGYAARAAAMSEALKDALGERFECNVPQGGMFMWGRLKTAGDARALLQHAIARKVTFVPGDIYFAERNDPMALRLSFSTPTPAQIREGVRRLGQAIDQMESV